MKGIFIALIHNMYITDNLGCGDKINERLKITNDPQKIQSLLTSDYMSAIGEMETASLLSGCPVVFSEKNIPSDMTPHQYLLACLYEIQTFLMTIWMFQDNSINCEIGYVFSESRESAEVSSNFVSHLYSTSEGERIDSSFTRDELRSIRLMHHKIVSAPEHPYELPKSQLTSRHPRVSRAIYLINGARGEADIAMKVAGYCSAFETLFSTSHSELSHQLAERISCYLYVSGDDRLSNYRKIKNAYGLRSKVVHGATLKEEKIDDAIAIVKYCDDISRMIFKKILSKKEEAGIFSKKNEDFDELMLKTIFGSNS